MLVYLQIYLFISFIYKFIFIYKFDTYSYKGYEILFGCAPTIEWIMLSLTVSV